MNKIKAAIILPYFGPGGAEKMAAQLAAGLDRERFTVEVFCIYGQPLHNHLEKMVQAAGVPIHFIGKKRGFSIKAVAKLFQALDKFGPDLIHTHQYACLYASPWAVARKKPFLHTLHTLPEIENKRALRRIVTKFLTARDIMTPVAISKSNQRMVADYYGLPLERVPMIHNPVDVKRFASGERTEDGQFRFITAGRFSPEKNQQMMYRAFASFVDNGNDARLLMLGKGAEEENLKSLARELKIDDRIDYAGFVPNVEDYLKTADVFLLSSHYEAQPLCVLESMAAGLPVISTDVGGVADIVTDNGILVAPGDAEAMADAMKNLRLDENLRKTMSSRSASHAAGFDVSNTIAGYSHLYARVISDKKLGEEKE